MIDTKTPTTFTFQPAGRDEPVNIRTTMIDGEPWFVGSDVLKVLDLDGSGMAYRRLAPTQMTKVSRADIGDPSRGKPMILISEPGLYALINRSDKPEARAFQDWVNGEVLPSIRKTGSYSLADHGREAMPLPMDIAEAVAGVRLELSAVKDLLADFLAAAKATQKRDTMMTATALLKRGIGRGFTSLRLGKALSEYSALNGYPVGQRSHPEWGSVNTYSLEAAEAWNITRQR